MPTKLRPITHIITSGTGPSPTKAYGRYKIVLEGTVRETGDPDRYCQWCKVGLGWNNNNPVYGSSYYTVESYDLVNGTYWATYSESNYPPSNLFVDNLYKKIDWTYNTGHKDDCYLEVIFNTNNAIVPTSIGLISPDNANDYPQRPEYFKLYGWDNGWDLITTVNGEDTLSGYNAESIFNISYTSSTIIRPLSIFEIEPEPPFPYQTVQIGTQTWMAADLAIDDGQGGIYTANLSDVNGYDLGTVYYYTHTAALRVADSINGWHLPTYSEWQTLFQYINNTYSESDPSSLRSTYAWNSNNGTNRFGFNILPVGNYKYGTSMESIGSRTCYWAYDDGGGYGRYRCMRFSEWTSDFDNVYSNESDNFQFTVRLIKD